MSLGPGTFVDHYQIEAFIGAGSMGDVYRATDVKLGRRVAVKVLSERHRDNDELRRRFEREARAVAAIVHPNVVQVYTTGHLGGLPYMAMEFLDGIDLGSAVERAGPWPPVPVCRAMADAAHGLQAASAAGLIHRDVKPANLVQLASGAVKVTDFGLAKPINPGDEAPLTAMGVVVGTPDYIAPEQARGEALDSRVDIYALGGSLFYLLCARPPFRTGDPDEDKYLKVVSRHLKKPAPDPRDSVPEVDDELAELTLRMMAKKAADRPDYDDVIAALQSIGDRLERGGSSAAIPRAVAPSGSGGSVAPTPYVGGAAPRAETLSSDDRTAQSSLPVRGARLSKPLVWMTVLSALVFLTGLGLTLFGPMPSRGQQLAIPADDGVPATPGAVDAATAPPPEPPDGMVLLTDESGRPAAFASLRPVTVGEYAVAFPEQRKATDRTRANPVTGVGYAEAVAFAARVNGRLPTDAEWRKLEAQPGFEQPARLWEWVDDDSAQSGRHRVRSGERVQERRDRGQKDVTFRVVRDL